LSGGNNWPVTGKDYYMSYVNDHVNTLTFANANNMTTAWSYFPTINSTFAWQGSFDAHPSIAHKSVYAADTVGRLYSFDVDNGTLNWSIMLSTNLSDRGTIEQFQTTPVVTSDFVLISCRHIFCVNRRTGNVVWSALVSGDTSIGPDGRPTSYYAYTGDITVIDDYVIVGSGSTQNEIVLSQLVNPNNTKLTATGSVVAFNLTNGNVIWRFNTTSDQSVPHPQYGAGCSPWSSPAIDKSRYTVYIGTGQSFEFPVSPYADSILALDYRTGVLLWSYQASKNDVYSRFYPNSQGDRDMSTHPNLFTLNINKDHEDDEGEGDSRDFVGAGSKNGKYYIFSRDQTSVNVTPLAILDIDFGSTLGGIQSTPAIRGDTMFIASHAVVDPFTGIRRSYNESSPYDIAFFSSKVTAINLVAVLENRTYELWSYTESAGLLKMTFGPMSITQNVVFQPSFAGYINIFNTMTGERLSSPIVPVPIGTPVGLAIGGAVTIASDRFCIGVGITFLGSNEPGGVICYKITS
jgi:glucose dehydrogenase